MSFYDKVQELCRTKGISITTLAIALGFSRSAPTTWKTSKTLPRANTVKKVAEYFEVPITYFSESANNIHDNHGVIGVTHAPVTINNGSESLGEIEVEILALCGKMNMKQKTALLTRAYELLENV